MKRLLNRIIRSLRLGSNRGFHVIGRGFAWVPYAFFRVNNKVTEWKKVIQEFITRNWASQCVRNRIFHTWARYRFYRLWRKVKLVTSWLWIQKQLDGQMAKTGTLFLSFGLLAFSIKPSENQSTPSRIIPYLPPTEIHPLISLFLVLLTLISMGFIFVIWKKVRPKDIFQGFPKWIFIALLVVLLFVFLWLVGPLVDLVPVISVTGIGILSCIFSGLFVLAVFCKWLNEKLTQIIEGSLRSPYWMLYWFVFTIGWIKGMALIPPDSIGQVIGGYLGFIWFLVVMLIMFKASWQIGQKNA
jgi:hypothetical protein